VLDVKNGAAALNNTYSRERECHEIFALTLTFKFYTTSIHAWHHNFSQGIQEKFMGLGFCLNFPEVQTETLPLILFI
jgi:hypothetical protein